MRVYYGNTWSSRKPGMRDGSEKRQAWKRADLRKGTDVTYQKAGVETDELSKCGGRLQARSEGVE
eukprot:1029910-Pleurochrysis_carterae.AAC.1